ncbi:MAG: terminase small subunit [Anaerolineae bacterium]
MSLTRRQRLFVDAYLRLLVGAAAAREAGCSERSARSQACRWLANVDVKAAIAQGLEERGVSRDSVLARLADQATGDIGRFFRVVEIWTESPLPTQEPALDESGKQVTRVDVDDDGTETVCYRMRQVVLDTSKLLDPATSHLVKKFTDSPKSGLSIELHDSQAALVHLGKHLKLFTEEARNLNVDLSLLTDEQLERLSAGEDLLVVLGTTREGGTGKAGAAGQGPATVEAIVGATE